MLILSSVYLNLSEAFILPNGGDQKKHQAECFYCYQLLEDGIHYKCLECRASDLCARCLLDHGEHCEIIKEINESHHAFLVLRQESTFNKDIFDLLF